MKKKVISLFLLLLLMMTLFSVSVGAVTNTKISEDLQKIVSQSDLNDSIKVTVWFAYPKSPEPDFTPEDYGESLDDIHRYKSDYREYKKSYYTEQNKKALEEVSSLISVDVIWMSNLTATADLSIKVRDIDSLAKMDIISSICYAPNEENVLYPQGNLFEDIYRAMVPKYAYGLENYYKELYYHFSENNEIDWALAKGDSCIQTGMNTRMVIANRVLTYTMDAENFKFGYGVYDAKLGKFVDLYDIRNDFSQYDGLSDVLCELNIGRPVGDIDGDNELTVCDATYIQKCLANICSYPKDDILDEIDELMFISDFNRDGKRDIMDATAIQKYLVSID